MKGGPTRSMCGEIMLVT